MMDSVSTVVLAKNFSRYHSRGTDNNPTKLLTRDTKLICFSSKLSPPGATIRYHPD